MSLPDLPEPILFHALKHHVLYIREFIRLQHMADDAFLKSALRTLGNSQLDLYLGTLSPLQIATETIAYLHEHAALDAEAYQQYIRSTGADYHVMALSDGGDWILRWGEVAGRHVHLHPARFSRDTMRIKANILKTAIAVQLAARRNELSMVDLQLVNQVRAEWLGLALLKQYAADEGLSKAIAMLSP